MIQIRNGICSEVSFSKNMSKIDILKMQSKELNVFDKSFKPTRNRAFVYDAINYEHKSHSTKILDKFLCLAKNKPSRKAIASVVGTW